MPGLAAIEKMMTRADLEAVTRQWISLWNAPVDWASFDRLHADDFEDLSPAGRGSSREAFAKGLADLMQAFPDLATRVEDILVDERAQRVAVRWSAKGTNVLPFVGAGPTDRLTPITGIEIIEIANGRIRKRWGEWDITAHRD